ncbi:hypothetical protein B0H19DRAFT_1275718 [Mycena capillaripes]|nr:hypothetical protein B0H19DRAFT_1275718 [Mycena capillaripes]
MSKRSRSQYIDDRADVDPHGEMDDNISDEDDKSTDAQLHWEDRARYNMPAIEAGHVARLRFEVPYRIPTQFLEGGAPPGLLLFPRWVPVRPHQHARLHRRATSTCPRRRFLPPTDTRHRFSSPTQTPYADPNYNFFPDADSHGPTPHVDNWQDSARHTSPTPPPSPSSERPTKKQRIEGPGIASRIRKYLDLAAKDSDNQDGDNEDEHDETMSDQDFLDDDDTGQQKIVSCPQLVDDEEDADAHALATRYELAAPEYEREAAREVTASSMGDWPVKPQRGDGRRFLADADVVPGTWARPQNGVYRWRPPGVSGSEMSQRGSQRDGRKRRKPNV